MLIYTIDVWLPCVQLAYQQTLLRIDAWRSYVIRRCGRRCIGPDISVTFFADRGVVLGLVAAYSYRTPDFVLTYLVLNGFSMGSLDGKFGLELDSSEVM